MGAFFEDPSKAVLHTEWGRPMPIPEHMPGEGSEVYNAKGQPIKLLERIGDIVTGEANVFRTEQSGCIKVFFPEKLTEAKIRKIIVMSRSRKDVYAVDPTLFKRIAWPDTVIYGDKEGKLPIGYRMRYFQNAKKLKISRRNRPDPLFSAKLACNVAKLAVFAEKTGFRLTDALSLRNMLYDQETGAVYIFDMDSAEFALKGVLYGTDVGLELEYAPERLVADCARAYHTAQEDAWQLQSILFQILLSAQPYLRKKGSINYKEDIAYGNYAFPRGMHTISPFELPHDKYRDDMMKLPARLRELFYHSFSGKGECFHAENRLSASAWLREMQQYQETLEKKSVKRNEEKSI